MDTCIFLPGIIQPAVQFLPQVRDEHAVARPPLGEIPGQLWHERGGWRRAQVYA